MTNAVLKAAWKGQDPTALPQIRGTLKIAFYSLCELGLPLVRANELLALEDSTGLRAYATNHSSNELVREFWRSIDQLPLVRRDDKLGGARRRLNEFLLCPAGCRRSFRSPHTSSTSAASWIRAGWC